MDTLSSRFCGDICYAVQILSAFACMGEILKSDTRFNSTFFSFLYF